MELLIVRHGESVANHEGRMQGHRDYPLSARGEEQAEILAAWLSGHGLSWHAAYCSPLSRARRTAEILVERLGGPAPELDDDLKELSLGSLEGRQREEIAQAHPEFLERGVTELGDYSAYGGESYAQVQARVARVRARLEARHRPAGHRVLVVGHGGFSFQLVKALICEPVPRVCILHWGNCTVALVRMRDRRGTYMGEIAWHMPVEMMGGLASEGAASLFR